MTTLSQHSALPAYYWQVDRLMVEVLVTNDMLMHHHHHYRTTCSAAGCRWQQTAPHLTQRHQTTNVTKGGRFRVKRENITLPRTRAAETTETVETQIYHHQDAMACHYILTMHTFLSLSRSTGVCNAIKWYTSYGGITGSLARQIKSKQIK